MATSFGATSGVGNRPLPPSMLTRPGSNAPVFAGHQTDATSGGAGGYGSYIDPNYYNLLSQYTQALPGVAAARLNLQTQGNQSYDQLRQNIQQSVINFGDPSVIQPLLAKYGMALDPQTAGLAAANTGGDGHWGNSIIGQLQQKARAALQNQLQSLGGRGFESSGGYGSAINNSNIDLGNKVYGEGQTLLGQLTGAINTNQDTQTKLSNAYANSLLSAPGQIRAHPELYPLPQTPYNTVGGGTPQTLVGKQQSPYPQVNPNTFRPSPGGAGAFPTRTGGLPPLPKPTTVAAPSLGGIGHQT